MQLDIKLKFSTHTVNRRLDYPKENVVELYFKNIKEKINVEQITINGILANIYYNTSFAIDRSDTVLYSIGSIEKDGIYRLELDDLYIRSHRSNKWHCSAQKEDFIFIYEFTRSSFTDIYRDRNHIGFDKKFIPCFGCSNTYGEGVAETETWPYLLSRKFNKNFLNLGVSGSGVDAIYNNLKLLYAKHKFDQCFILVPPFERRIVRAQIEGLCVKMFSNVRTDNKDSDWQFLKDKEFQKKFKTVNDKIVNDVGNRYSKKFLKKIINFCRDNDIKLHCSSWHKDVYEYLKECEKIILLPKFPDLTLFKERADDGAHPHKKHYQYFVDQINLQTQEDTQ
jgi:hypothetical protein